ncbi:hypothetical protein POM88_000198 [Heracleum sosnowskyi]|uniref:Uncharacterized protein n=1 Tax=Heracleum sosnowskyi TaxID=360622 RepID=A0AAD8NAN1_9APIA|nr:hypothetical protein POM88_000198 [Heracleum sosnowskyi]
MKEKKRRNINLTLMVLSLSSLASSMASNTRLQTTDKQINALTTITNQLQTTATSHDTPPLQNFCRQLRPIRIDISPFDGTNPLDWILQTERYFDIHQTPHHHRMEVASFFFRG